MDATPMSSEQSPTKQTKHKTANKQTPKHKFDCVKVGEKSALVLVQICRGCKDSIASETNVAASVEEPRTYTVQSVPFIG